MPSPLLTAIEAVSWTIPCLPCGQTVEISYSQSLDCPVIRHPVKHPVDDAGAIALARFVQDEIARHVTLADYGEPAPLNVIIPGAVPA